MAGSRLTNYGTIFTRVTGLLKSGAVKDVPIWYDVYRKYPPDVEPLADRSLPPQDPIPEIVYEEDFDRAKMAGFKYRKSEAAKRSRVRVRQSQVANVMDTVVKEAIVKEPTDSKAG